MATADLLVMVGFGNVRAFEAVYDRTVALVLDVTARILPTPQACRDVTREVFVEVWRTAAHFDPTQTGAHGWLLNLARVRAIEHTESLIHG